MFAIRLQNFNFGDVFEQQVLLRQVSNCFEIHQEYSTESGFHTHIILNSDKFGNDKMTTKRFEKWLLNHRPNKAINPLRTRKIVKVQPVYDICNYISYINKQNLLMVSDGRCSAWDIYNNKEFTRNDKTYIPHYVE